MLRLFIAAIVSILIWTVSLASAAERPLATLYKNPQCGCCEQYADYLRSNGFTVKVIPSHNISLIRRQAGLDIPETLEGCHTTFIGKYVVEGHVPVGAIDKLLTEGPAIRGISLPGMPDGSPGMSGQKTEAFTIYEIRDDAALRVFATE